MNVVLVEPEIPQNTGNIGRLCVATRSILHLVGPLGFRISSAELKRAGMDYWEHLDVRFWNNLAELQAAAPAGSRLFYVTPRGSRLYTEPHYQQDDYLVFGRESVGLPPTLIESNPDRCIRIPMWNERARSLNLATAVAVVLYEALRQTRRF